MNIESMRLFITIAETRSITKAAELTHISQSALSQQIKAMENTVDSQLMERSNRGITLTEAGELFYRSSLDMVALYDSMLERMERLKGRDEELVILATPVIHSYALPCTLFHIKERFPSITLSMSGYSSDIIEEKIAAGQGDIGFITGRPVHRNLEAKKIYSDKVYLTVGYKTAVPDRLSMEELGSYPLVLAPPSTKSRQLLDAYLGSRNIRPGALKISYLLDSNESLKQSAINGHGMTFLPYMTIKKELYEKELRIVELEGFNLSFDYYMVRNKNFSQPSRTVQALISYLEKVFIDTIC